jgi:hypothetical protein
MNNRVSTTVKIDPILYDEFKVLGVRHKHTLQKLVEKAVFRYVREESFRNELNNFNIPLIDSGGTPPNPTVEAPKYEYLTEEEFQKIRRKNIEILILRQGEGLKFSMSFW